MEAPSTKSLRNRCVSSPPDGEQLGVVQLRRNKSFVTSERTKSLCESEIKMIQMNVFLMNDKMTILGNKSAKNTHWNTQVELTCAPLKKFGRVDKTIWAILYGEFLQ